MIREYGKGNKHLFSVNKGVSYGRETWVEKMVERYNLQTTRRCAGRPRKGN